MEIDPISTEEFDTFVTVMTASIPGAPSRKIYREVISSLLSRVLVTALTYTAAFSERIEPFGRSAESETGIIPELCVLSR